MLINLPAGRISKRTHFTNKMIDLGVFLTKHNTKQPIWAQNERQSNMTPKQKLLLSVQTLLDGAVDIYHKRIDVKDPEVWLNFETPEHPIFMIISSKDTEYDHNIVIGKLFEVVEEMFGGIDYNLIPSPVLSDENLLDICQKILLSAADKISDNVDHEILLGLSHAMGEVGLEYSEKSKRKKTRAAYKPKKLSKIERPTCEECYFFEYLSDHNEKSVHFGECLFLPPYERGAAIVRKKDYCHRHYQPLAKHLLQKSSKR